MKKLISLFVLMALATTTAFCMDLDEAKKTGKVGELPNGYLAAVEKKPAAAILKMIAKINAKRKKKYMAISNKNGTPIAVVEKMAGEKVIGKIVKKGEFYKKDIKGDWVKK